jgi:hypothetical protein
VQADSSFSVVKLCPAGLEARAVPPSGCTICRCSKPGLPFGGDPGVLLEGVPKALPCPAARFGLAGLEAQSEAVGIAEASSSARKAVSRRFR